MARGIVTAAKLGFAVSGTKLDRANDQLSSHHGTDMARSGNDWQCNVFKQAGCSEAVTWNRQHRMSCHKCATTKPRNARLWKNTKPDAKSGKGGGKGDNTAKGGGSAGDKAIKEAKRQADAAARVHEDTKRKLAAEQAKVRQLEKAAGLPSSTTTVEEKESIDKDVAALDSQIEFAETWKHIPRYVRYSVAGAQATERRQAATKMGLARSSAACCGDL